MFCFDFDYDEWPSTHNNEETYLRPYNESIYNIMHHYKTVFPEEEFDDIMNDDGSQKAGISSDKIFKIKYTINLLPYLGMHVQMVEKNGKLVKKYVNNHYSFLDECTEADQLEMFESESLVDMIDFKWNEFGMNHHKIFCFFHFC